MASATADQVAEAASHIRNVIRTIQYVGNDWNAGVRAGAETELGKALTALGEQPSQSGGKMTDFDPDTVYHVTYDGWPIMRQVSKDGQTNPIGFNDRVMALDVRKALREELTEEYMDDTEHTQASAQAIANERIKVVQEKL